jgi:integrase
VRPGRSGETYPERRECPDIDEHIDVHASHHSDTDYHLGIHHYAQKAGLTCRLHDLRHSHASQLLAAGVDVKTISERLGHSSTSFTLDSYVHPARALDEDAAVRWETALDAAQKKGTNTGNQTS